RFHRILSECHWEPKVVRASLGSFFFSRRRRHTRFKCDWSSDVCSSDLAMVSTISRKWARLREIVETIAAKQEKVLVFTQFRELRSEERRVGKECRSQ